MKLPSGKPHALYMRDYRRDRAHKCPTCPSLTKNTGECDECKVVRARLTKLHREDGA